MTKHAVIYDRASTKMQQDNWSRVNAKDVGIRIAETNGYTWEYVKEIGSGTTLTGRPKMLAILDRIAAKEVQALIVQDLDRLARPIERAVYETIRNICLEYDVIVHTHSGTFDFADDDSDFVADINMAVSKKETRRIRKRMRRGKVAKAEAGGFLGGGLPLGYKVIYTEVKGKNKPVSDLAIDENEKELVQVIFDTLEIFNGNIGAVAIHLNELGYLGKRGCPFVPNTLRELAKRQLYIGLMSSAYTDRIVYRPDLQIISVKQFERVSKLIKNRKSGKKDSGNRGKYPFTGLIVCGTCGGPMVAANHKKGALYACTNRRKYGKSVCLQGKSYNQALVIDAMTTFLAEFLQDQIDLKAMLDKAADEHGKTISEQAHEATVMGDLKAVKLEKERVIDYIGKGIISEDEAKKKLDALREEEQNLTREIASISEKTAIRDDYLRAIDMLKDVDIKAELMDMAETEPVTFRRFIHLIFEQNSLQVRTERKEGHNWQAVIEGYELTEAVIKETSEILSFGSNRMAML